MRGKHGHTLVGRRENRIIPAHAGQTWPWPPTRPSEPDHPRACGANPVMVGILDNANGSSPRMRGKLLPLDISSSCLRIIPAHAGQTVLPALQPLMSADHPRACGANTPVSVMVMAVSGSSPRMRGKRSVGRIRADRRRIIPAHAGQTCRPIWLRRKSPDHPRACGANRSRMSRPGWRSGSSPRMRGKQSDFMRKLLSAGPSIIGFAQWLQSSYYCSCLQSSAKTPISRGTTPTSLFLGFQNSITLLLLT